QTFQGSWQLNKIDSNTVTLTGTTTAATPWAIQKGVLAISSGGVFGDTSQTVSFSPAGGDSATLRFTSNVTLNNPISLGGGGATAIIDLSSTSSTVASTISGQNALTLTGSGGTLT